MQVNNLDDITEPDGVRKFLLGHRTECCLSENFQITKIKRQLVLSSDTYAMLYEIDDGGSIRSIRVNASAVNSRENAYQTMIKLSKKFSGSQYMIPKVYFYDPEYNAVAYENIEGHLLIDLIKQGSDLKKPIALAGLWLKKLHSGDDLVVIHGDYQPTNIIINDDSICVFDFNDSKTGETAIDIASFLSQLRVMLLRFSSLNDYKKLESIFLENYGLEFDRSLFQKFSKEKYLEIHNTLSNSMDEEEKPLLKEIYKFYEEA